MQHLPYLMERVWLWKACLAHPAHFPVHSLQRLQGLAANVKRRQNAPSEHNPWHSQCVTTNTLLVAL